MSRSTKPWKLWNLVLYLAILTFLHVPWTSDIGVNGAHTPHLWGDGRAIDPQIGYLQQYQPLPQVPAETCADDLKYLPPGHGGFIPHNSGQPQLPRNNLQYQTSLNNSGVSLNVQYNVHIHLPQNDVLSESPTKNPIGGSGKNAAKSTIKPLTGLIDTENGLTYYYEYDPNIVPFDKQPILFVVPDPSNQPLPQPQNLPMQPHTPGNSPMYLNSAASVQPPSNTLHPNGSSTMRYNLNPSTQHSNYSNAVMQNAPTPNPQHHVSTNSDLKVQSAPQMLSDSTKRRQNTSVSAMQNGRNANMLQNSSTAGTLQGVPTNPVQQVQSAFDTHHWHIPRSQTPYVYTKRDYRNAFHFPDFIFNHDLPPIPEEASPTTPVHRLQPRQSVKHKA